MSLITVFGATGAQGGSVVRQLLKDNRWKVRGVTRDVNSEKSKELASKGVEVVAADLFDVKSLERAVEGAYGIFLVTLYWEFIPGHGLDGAGEQEVIQFKNLAVAASKSKTLEHLVLSTLPPADKSSGGKFKVPHSDYKEKGVEWIRKNTPELWAKSSEYWAGFYTSNLWTLPFTKPPGSGAYLLLLPSKPSATVSLAGDLETNTGIIVEALLKLGPKAFDRIAMGTTDLKPIRDLAVYYEKVTGKPTKYVEVSDEAFEALYGPYGKELAAQLRWSESVTDWENLDPGRVISHQELGVNGKLIGFEEALVAAKDKLE
ncbi:hypothetical protein BGZ61DRAFT_341837 [Ilyonectria robusta]|uniref:uncharacterized protein n=1 Tax=Ilyonectria robusta TaxID=1079257 RepID=UPI001E8D9469|nr:uncharacterized protein BGZ61DRAFT_341837 [Ilyonectria robusta]KAH8734214.1 hypothetical protein BGZ61DRAFT_341837 [Ilyonectria robusta]